MRRGARGRSRRCAARRRALAARPMRDAGATKVAADMPRQLIHHSSHDPDETRPRRPRRFFITRILLYGWALPTTIIGLLLLPLALLTGGRVRVVDGVLEMHGGIVTLLLRHCTLLKGGASALTLGHVVLGRNALCLETSRTHERVHVRQCE